MVLNYFIVGHHNLWSCSYFGLDLVRSEFELQGLRIDTLAFDTDSKGFVIIKYKKDRNMSVVDPGVAYLNLYHNQADSWLIL